MKTMIKRLVFAFLWACPLTLVASLKEDTIHGTHVRHRNLQNQRGSSSTINPSSRNSSSSSSWNTTSVLGRDKIIGGHDVVAPGIFPYFSSVSSYRIKDICGGSLVAPDMILTAGHCLTEAYFVGGQAIVGAYTLVTPTPGYSHLVKVVRTYQHPNYVPFDNDLLLVKFEPAVFSILPITLNFDDALPVPGPELLTIMGFGSINDHYTYARTLQEAHVPQVNYSDCQQFFPFIQENQHLCVRSDYPLKETCSGDSGGPLVLDNNLQVGVLSFGAATCTDGPSVFSRTSRYRNYLQNGICDLSQYPPAYLNCTR